MANSTQDLKIFPLIRCYWLVNLVIHDCSCPPTHLLPSVTITGRRGIGDAQEPPFQPILGTRSCTLPQPLPAHTLLIPANTSSLVFGSTHPTDPCQHILASPCSQLLLSSLLDPSRDLQIAPQIIIFLIPYLFGECMFATSSSG